MKKLLFSKLAYPLLAVLLTGTMLFGGIYMLLTDSTYGWFSMNRNTSATGSSVKVVAKNVRVEVAPVTYDTANEEWTDGAYTEITPDTALDFRSLTIPGSEIRFRVRVTNVGSQAITLKEVGFAAFDASEEVAKNGLSLGTQLQARVDSAATVRGPLAAYLTGSSGTLAAAADLPLFTTETALEANGSVTFTVAVEFPNREEDQSGYAGFGNGSGRECCARRIYCRFE